MTVEGDLAVGRAGPEPVVLAKGLEAWPPGSTPVGRGVEPLHWRVTLERMPVDVRASRN